MLRVLLAALADRRLHPGKTVLDSSSGNVGIAYAMIGQIVGLPVETRRVSRTREKRRRVREIAPSFSISITRSSIPTSSFTWT